MKKVLAQRRGSERASDVPRPVEVRAGIFQAMALHHDLLSALTHLDFNANTLLHMHARGLRLLDEATKSHLEKILAECSRFNLRIGRIRRFYPLAAGALRNDPLSDEEIEAHGSLNRFFRHARAHAGEILAYAQTLHEVNDLDSRMANANPSQQTELLALMFPFARHLSEIIEDHLRPVDAPFSVNEVLHDVKRRHPTVNIHIPRRALFVMGRRVVFSRAVENVVTNAKKFGEMVSIDVNTTINSRKKTGQNAGQAELQISDNGPGIPPELQKTIFTPGVTDASKQRTDAGQPSKEGQGMGLAFARSVMRLMNGSISVKSDNRRAFQPRCTTFKLGFPLTRERPDNPRG